LNTFLRHQRTQLPTQRQAGLAWRATPGRATLLTAHFDTLDHGQHLDVRSSRRPPCSLPGSWVFFQTKTWVSFDSPGILVTTAKVDCAETLSHRPARR
jgi:hypothetical protein